MDALTSMLIFWHVLKNILFPVFFFCNDKKKAKQIIRFGFIKCIKNKCRTAVLPYSVLSLPDDGCVNIKKSGSLTWRGDRYVWFKLTYLLLAFASPFFVHNCEQINGEHGWRAHWIWCGY